MSLAKQMRLAELKAKEKEYLNNRADRHFAILPSLAMDHLNKAHNYFSDKGFTVTERREGFDATYHELVVKASLSGLEPRTFISDFLINFEINKREWSVGVILSSQTIPTYCGSTEADRQIAWYENVLLPKLAAMGSSDIDGSCRYFVLNNIPPIEQKKADDFEQALSLIFD
ncbi:hypothetical protein IFU23_14020 [Pantoea agglomerans]|uniref:hypothetical protein n=1 Tax=Enterobacter agglomerans TaxID=549 RepID=UPI0017825E31|nr:hypothetical protein [Pantoea agglomerans]MBD8159217.1 hypothetical protein [Pantoea agglomerans]MBD8230299.1 hypothetical protein [Pantoea agglomerans]